MSEKPGYLKNCELFAPLEPDDLRLLETHSRRRSFPPKSSIYVPSGRADSVFLLISGRIKICHFTSEGKQSVLAFVEPGEIFGELALIDAAQRDNYAQAVQRSTVVIIPADLIRQLMERRANLAFRVAKLIGLRRRRVERRLKNVLFLSHPRRLAHLLLDLADQYGVRTQEGVELKMKLSHQDMASIIGSTRETVTVVLGRLQAEGCVRIRRRTVVLVRPEQLAQRVGRT